MFLRDESVAHSLSVPLSFCDLPVMLALLNLTVLRVFFIYTNTSNLSMEIVSIFARFDTQAGHTEGRNMAQQITPPHNTAEAQHIFFVGREYEQQNVCQLSCSGYPLAPPDWRCSRQWEKRLARSIERPDRATEYPGYPAQLCPTLAANRYIRRS